jgi:hypothetical protein
MADFLTIVKALPPCGQTYPQNCEVGKSTCGERAFSSQHIWRNGFKGK